MTQTAVTHLFKSLLERESAPERELGCSLARNLVAANAINRTHCAEALTKVLAAAPGATTDKGRTENNSFGTG